eukprot:8701198-Pyramimonas_sp.AAC.1
MTPTRAQPWYDPKAKYKKKTRAIYLYLLTRKLSQRKVVWALLAMLALLWFATMADDIDPVYTHLLPLTLNLPMSPTSFPSIP